MAVICGFVCFCNAHEKQQILCKLFVCVWLCVCVSERERKKQSPLEIRLASTKDFCFF